MRRRCCFKKKVNFFEEKIDNIGVMEILHLVEIKKFFIATGLYHQNGRMECWNVGILGLRAEINHFNCKKTP